MQVLHHRPSMICSRNLASARQSLESNDAIKDQVWVLDKAYENSEEDMKLSSTTDRGRLKNTPNHLRINTYSKADLHDRYMSSEEEPSPSPDSDIESNEDDLALKVPEKMAEVITEPVLVDEYETQVAVAVPILARGSARLVDLAPMHKRKRTEQSSHSRIAVKNAALRMPTVTDDNNTFVAIEAIKSVDPDDCLPKRKDSLRTMAPGSWHPDDGVHIVQEEDDDEDGQYFPDLELRKAPTYHDYDPYSLSPPRLSPRNSYNTTNKKPGSVARARNSSNPAIAQNGAWRGFSRSMSLAKKQTLHRADHQVSKKPKMIPRAANEREEPVRIPSFHGRASG